MTELSSDADLVQILRLVRFRLHLFDIGFLLLNEAKIKLHLFLELRVLFFQNLGAVNMLHCLRFRLLKLILGQLHLLLNVQLDVAFVEHVNATLGLIGAVAEAIQGLEVSTLIRRPVEVARLVLVQGCTWVLCQQSLPGSGGCRVRGVGWQALAQIAEWLRVHLMEHVASIVAIILLLHVDQALSLIVLLKAHLLSELIQQGLAHLLICRSLVMQLNSLLLDLAHENLDLLFLPITLLVLHKRSFGLAAHRAERLAHVTGEVVLRGLVERVVELLRSLMRVA